MKPYFKKGNIAAVGAVSAIITLIVGVAVATLVLIFTGALGGQTYNLVEPQINDIYGTVANGSTFTASTSPTLLRSNLDSATVVLFNTTTKVPTSNYSVTYDGYVSFVSGSPWIGKSINASYTYGDSTIEAAVKDSITASFSAQKQTSQYLPIIVLAVVIFIVLALVLGMGALTGGNGGMQNTAL
jgi:hypothetical protein